MPNRIDLNNALAEDRYAVEVKPREDDDERRSRLMREEARDRFQQWRDEWMFKIGCVAVSLVGGVCLWMSVDLDFSADQQRWAQSTIASMITAVLGYLVGRGTK